jgi:hypothetical protein
MKHIMLDLETLSTEANAVIVQIGAVWFNPHGDQYTITPGSARWNELADNPEYGGMLPHDLFSMCFERTIDAQTCLDAGMAVSGGTLKWWAEQGDDARKRVFGGETSMREALNDFSDFVNMVATDWPAQEDSPVTRDEVCVWGHGPAFDNALIRNAFHRFGYVVPWSFRNDRCNRTFVALAEEQLGQFSPELERIGTFHNALDDAITQAMHIQKLNAVLTKLRAGELVQKAAA